MTSHDDLCDIGSCQAPEMECAFCDCRCLCGLIAKVRADERERVGRERVAHLPIEPMAHAEAVAARLVEVICEDEEAYQDALAVQAWQALKDGESMARAQIAADIERAGVAESDWVGAEWRDVVAEFASIARGES